MSARHSGYLCIYLFVIRYRAYEGNLGKIDCVTLSVVGRTMKVNESSEVDAYLQCTTPTTQEASVPIQGHVREVTVVRKQVSLAGGVQHEVPSEPLLRGASSLKKPTLMLHNFVPMFLDLKILSQ
jgi:cell division FtsZ-interacting protein ZapD